MINQIRNNISAVLIILILLASPSINYSQEKMSKVIPEKPKYEYLNSDGETYGRRHIDSKTGKLLSSSEVYKLDRRNTKNYFRIDYSGTSLWNGKHWLPDKFPLKVFVRESKSNKYKSLFKDYIEYGFKVWEQADSRIQYKFIDSPGEADIVILFEENLMDKYDENFLGLTDYELGRNRQIEVSTVEISLLKYKNEMLSDGEIKATIIHEIGHALGLGHSSNSADLMYPYIDPESSADMDYSELSRGDQEAIRSAIDLCYYLKYTWN